MLICTQNQTYYHDKSGYWVSFQYVQRLRRKWTEHANKWNFTKSKGHNSIVLIIKPDLDIIIIDLYTKFHLNTYNLCEINEMKLLADWATDSSKAIRPTFFEWGHKKEYLVDTWIQMKRKSSIKWGVLVIGLSRTS